MTKTPTSRNKPIDIAFSDILAQLHRTIRLAAGHAAMSEGMSKPKPNHSRRKPKPHRKPKADPGPKSKLSRKHKSKSKAKSAHKATRNAQDPSSKDIGGPLLRRSK